MTLKQKAKLTNSDEFNRRFDQLAKKYPDQTYYKIYEMVEEEHIEVFDTTKYSSYQSFRVVRSRMMKKILNGDDC